MSVGITIKWETAGIKALRPLDKSIARALSKAGSTALRDMRSEASKRIRQRKRLQAGVISKAFHLRRPKATSIDGMLWALDVSGKPVRLIDYPHRQTRKGVSVEVNRGKRTLVVHAFIARMTSGHEGIFRRVGRARLPIHELLGSRPVDALLHEGEVESVAARGEASFVATFERVLPLEMAKEK